jgi:hypothetical protein
MGRPLAVLLLGLSLSAVAVDPAVVRIAWLSPATFTDFGDRRHADPAAVEAYADELGKHLSERANAMLAPGDRLQVTIHDVDMAGAFEPALRSSWTDVRIMKEIYPPRIDLDFALDRADGTHQEGRRKLEDLHYLVKGAGRFGNDRLRYEKALLDDWIARDLRPPR